MTDMPRGWLSTAKAAEGLGITTRTLYRMIDSGDLPAYRFGRVIRLKATEVDAFIETRRIKPGSLHHLYPPAVEGDEPRDGAGGPDDPDEQP